MERDPVYVDADPTSLLPAMSADEMRMAFYGWQRGVYGASDMKVVPGANLTIDVWAGRALVDSSIGTAQASPRYAIYLDQTKNSANFEAGAIPANGSSNPRLDAVVARVYDDTQDGSGQRKWRLQYMAGTPTSGAALGGALPTLPASSLLLAEVLTPGGNPGAIPAGNIRDRRAWARGAYRAITLAGGNFPVTDTAQPGTILDAVNLNPRIEFTGTPARVRISGNVQTPTTDGWVAIQAMLDGVEIRGSGQGPTEFITPGPGNRSQAFTLLYPFTPSAGSHLVSVAAFVGGGSTVGTVLASGNTPLSFEVEEVARQHSDNS